MAQNFRIIAYPDSQRLRVTLLGDFDGSSAFELVIFLTETVAHFREITVDTAGLGALHAFGAQTFRKNLGELKALMHRISFGGRYADELWPDNCNGVTRTSPRPARPARTKLSTPAHTPR